MNDGIHFTDVCQKFIAQSFAFACAFYQSGNINNFNLCRNNPVGFHQFRQFIQPFIRNIYQTYIGFNSTKTIIACLCFCAVAYRIK